MVHEASKPSPIATQIVYFQFSPDSKHVVMTYPISNPTANMIKTTDVFAVQNWNDPVYSLPTRMYSVAFDDGGRLYAASSTGDMPLYADAAKKNDVFQAFSTYRRAA